MSLGKQRSCIRPNDARGDFRGGLTVIADFAS